MPLTIIHQFMLLILSKDQTTSRLGPSELLVVMSKFYIDVNFQASDPRDKFFMERRVSVIGHFTNTWRSVDDYWKEKHNPTRWATQESNQIDVCLFE